MRALSLTRPWSSLVLFGGKTIENRTWNTGYRGPVLIHAAKSWDKDAAAYAREILPALSGEWTRPELCPVGIVGAAKIGGVCLAQQRSPADVCDCGPWAMAGQAHWRLTDVHAFPEALPVPGQLGLWKPGSDIRDWALANLVAGAAL